MAKDIFGDEVKSKNVDDFSSMLEASLQNLNKKFVKGDKVMAEILTIGKEEVFVSVEGQDGMVLKSELLNQDQTLPVQVGEHLSLYVVKKKDGILQLTTKPSSKALSDSLEDAFDFESAVEGKVLEATQAGFQVQVFHKKAFCPMSQMDSKPISNPQDYVGKKFDFIITKFEEGGRNIVVSRRKLLDQDKLVKEGEFIESHKIGDSVNGKVSRIENFGAFVQLADGLEGLVHISEIGWSRLAHPSEALQIGDLVTAKILKMEEDDRGRLKISLSRKQASEDPWMNTVSELKLGALVDGKIKEKMHFGWFIELKPGVVGLLPKSAFKEIQDEKELEQKKQGEVIKVIVNTVSLEDRKISLQLPRDQEEIEWKQSMNQTATKGGMGTLGDKFSHLLNSKRGK